MNKKNLRNSLVSKTQLYNGCLENLSFAITYKLYMNERRNKMGCLGNILWIIFGGAEGALAWFLYGCLWSITIVGIPIGRQCFKFASLTLFPFGKEVEYGGGGISLIANVIWMIVTGIPMAVGHFLTGCLLCITIIGVPFGLQQFKLAKLALMPFGSSL